MTLDQVLWQLKQHFVVPVSEGGTPYAYRFYVASDLEEDGRLIPHLDAPLVEVRAFADGNYTLTSCDEGGRHIAAPHPPEATDNVPMAVGAHGVAQPAAIKHPMPESDPAPEVAAVAEEADVPPPGEPPVEPRERTRWARFWGLDVDNG